MPLAHVDLLYSARRRWAAVQTSDIASPQQPLVGIGGKWLGRVDTGHSVRRKVRRAAGCMFLRCTADLKRGAFDTPLCGCGA